MAAQALFLNFLNKTLDFKIKLFRKSCPGQLFLYRFPNDPAAYSNTHFP